MAEMSAGQMSFAHVKKKRVLRWRNVAVQGAIAWLALMLVIAILADRLAPYDYAALDLRHRLAAPIGFGGTYRICLAPTSLAGICWRAYLYRSG